MPKNNTEKHPLVRDPISTRSHTQESMSGERTVQSSNAIPATPMNEQRAPKNRYVIISPTLGPVTLEQLLKGNSDSITQL